MTEIALNAEDFAAFSVPHSLCLAGEHQYVLGQGSIVVATSLRLYAEVAERPEDELRIVLRGETANAEPAALAAAARWRAVVQKLGPQSLGDPAGLEISLGFGEPGRECPPDVLLAAPAMAVALVCALAAHRAAPGPMPIERAAELACEWAQEFSEGAHSCPWRYYAECLMSLEGGARYVAPSSLPLDVQLMVAPESLILVLSPEALAPGGGQAWQGLLRGAIGKLGGEGVELLRSAQQDMAAFFGLASESLDDRETAVLYGLLRVRQMISGFVEKLELPTLDHDLLAELCDEESAILEDYFEFPGEMYGEVRDRAAEIGALGAKLTYAFGARPAVAILAPGRRDMVCEVLKSEFEGYCCLALDVVAAGADSSAP